MTAEQLAKEMALMTRQTQYAKCEDLEKAYLDLLNSHSQIIDVEGVAGEMCALGYISGFEVEKIADIIRKYLKYVSSGAPKVQISQTDFLILVMAVVNCCKDSNQDTYEYMENAVNLLVKKYDIKGV